jgi:class 3 adenylate cyclase
MKHVGRIVQTGGDSLLIVFDSIDGAVRCAVGVQRDVPANDGDVPPDHTIRFRIGINIGDAISWRFGFRRSVRRAASALGDQFAIMCKTGSI